MRKLNKIVTPLIKAEWENVAYSMGYGPSTVDAIEKEAIGKLERCCTKLFKDWLTTDHGCTPKTWKTLLERIKENENLVAAAEKILEKLGNSKFKK